MRNKTKFPWLKRDMEHKNIFLENHKDELKESPR